MLTRFPDVFRQARTKTLLAITSLLVVMMTISGGLGFGAVNAHTSSTSRPSPLSGKAGMHLVKSGVVDLSKASTLKANPNQQLRNLQINLPLPAAARNRVQHRVTGTVYGGPGLPRPSRRSPNFLGGGTVPFVQAAVPGLNSTQAGGWYPPDQAIGVGGGTAVNNSWVVQGVNNAIDIENTAYGHVAGPYASSTLFASVMTSGDFFSDPQITYDATRVRWVIVYLELTPNSSGQVTHGYIDMAVSKNISPVGVPTNYNVYKWDIGINSNTEWCDYPTMGMDYWDVWVTCATFSTPSYSGGYGVFLGNRTWGFFKTPMYLNSGTFWDVVYGSIGTDLNCSSACLPAFRVAPATEDGAPIAEYVIATDVAYGVTSQNLTVCAITNTKALGSGVAPTISCGFDTLPGSYADPIGAPQLGTTTLIPPTDGVKQFAYKGGNLWFSFTTSVFWSGDTATRDGNYWAEIHPVLSTLASHNPQLLAGWDNIQQGYFGFIGGYTYNSSIQPSDEGDAAMILNYSDATSNFPDLLYTGRQNDDAYNTMGQGSGWGWVIQGSNPNGSGRWGDYTACSINIQPTTRHLAYCAGEYGGADASAGGTGWDTELVTLRME